MNNPPTSFTSASGISLPIPIDGVDAYCLRAEEVGEGEIRDDKHEVPTKF